MGNNNINRRQFVKSVTAGTGSAFLGKSLLSELISTTDSSLGPLKSVSLGSSGLKSTLLGMGTGFSGYNRSSNITRSGNAESLIKQAYEKGIRFFDCADTYGTHPYTASALKGIPRENYTLSSKIWVSPGGIPGPERPDADIVVDRFRRELQTDYIDLLQIHCMTDRQWTDKQKKQMDILENLKAKKIILAHGVSVHSLEAMEASIASSWVDVIHVRINPYGEAMDNKNPSVVIPVIEKLHKAGKGVIGMKLIGNGKFTNESDKIEESLKYVLGLGYIDMVIIGFEYPEQIDNYIERVNRNLKLYINQPAV